VRLIKLLDTLHIEFDVDSDINIVQITDTHLGAEPNTPLVGMDTDDSLGAVLELVRARSANPNLLIATGDLSDRGALDAYFRLRKYTRDICEHQFWLLGNHDHAETLRKSAEENGNLLRNDIRIGSWQILMLNSQIPGEVGGRLGPRQQAILEQGLEHAAEAGLYTLVCLHHQPQPVGSAWIDSQAVRDADEMFETLVRYKGVKGVLWGHVHQEVDYLYEGVRMLATPSTCIQFAKHSDDFKIDDLPPGYRSLRLLPSGEIETVVHRVTDRQFQVDLDSPGYL